MPKTLLRREFLQASAALAAPLFIPARALGRDGNVAPSDRIVMGAIGLNGMGTGDMRSFLGCPDAMVVAVCDVDRSHRLRARRIVEDFYGAAETSGAWKGCQDYNDFRDVVSRTDLDAVLIATPDHWHVPIALAAVQSGKDVYCEKPISLTMREGRILSDAVARYGRILQVGSQLRSTRNVRHACELVRNGRIGKLHTIRTYLPFGPTNDPQPVQPVPEGFDYEMWLGPAPWAPYTEARCHYSFRWVHDYAGGNLTDLGAHDNDIAQWGHGSQYTGPVEVEGEGYFPPDGLFDTASRFELRYRYADGVQLICTTANIQGARFEGTEGWVFVRFDIDAEPKSLLTTVIGAGEIHLYDSSEHHQNFLDCVKSRRQPIAPVEVGHRSITICHIGNICLKLGRKLKWDPEREEFPGDAEANRLLSAPMRAPWQIV